MKVREVGAYEAKTHLAALLNEVEQGKTVYINRRGKRVAELRPVTEEKVRPVFGSAKGLVVSIAKDFDAPLKEFKEYMK